VTTATRRRRKSPARRWLVWGLVCVLVFAAGLALGQALEDSPRSGQTTTEDRTFTVRPESATVTVTAP
jgi:hypothetical protein